MEVLFMNVVQLFVQFIDFHIVSVNSCSAFRFAVEEVIHEDWNLLCNRFRTPVSCLNLFYRRCINIVDSVHEPDPVAVVFPRLYIDRKGKTALQCKNRIACFITQREVLNNMVVEENGTISHYSMPADRKAELGVGLEDTKDLVDIIRVMQGVKVAVIFEDLEDGKVRVSLRSKDPQVDVSAIAAIHGGGGHCMASGIRMLGPLEDAREKVLNSIRTVVRSLS